MMFQYEFMRYAFLASTFIAITCGVVGVYVVARSYAFLAHTLSEIGFAGAAFAVFIGIAPLWGCFCSPCLVRSVLANCPCTAIKRNRQLVRFQHYLLD